MKIYEDSKWIDWETCDAACWLAAETGLTREAAKHHILANLTADEEGDYDKDELYDLAMILSRGILRNQPVPAPPGAGAPPGKDTPGHA